MVILERLPDAVEILDTNQNTCKNPIAANKIYFFLCRSNYFTLLWYTLEKCHGGLGTGANVAAHTLASKETLKD